MLKTIKKLELIINEYKEKLYLLNEKKQREIFMRMFGVGMEEDREKKGKGR